MSNWTLIDREKENTNNYDSRSTALDQADQLHALGVDDLGLIDPNGNEAELDFSGDEVTIESIEDGDDESDDSAAEATVEEQEVAADGKGEVVVEADTDAADADVSDAMPDSVPEEAKTPDARNVSDDPLLWMPDEFTDEIDGSTAINRKGYAVIAHHYGIDVRSEVQVGPAETEFEYAQVTAVATTRDGKEYRAHGSAHVDRGDDHFLLLEMADTRAQKRALAMATGVGTVAVEELQNELGGA